MPAEDVTIRTADVQLRTCKLTKSILKQMRRLTYEDMRANNYYEKVVGWIHGEAVNSKDATILLIKISDDGDYAIFNGHFEHQKKYKQIFVV